MAETFLNGRVTLHCGDARDVLATIPDCSIDSIVTDPPYALVSIVKRFGNTSPDDKTQTSQRVRDRADGYARLTAGGFMGQKWDTGETVFGVEFWAECLRVLKPGGHLIAFGGTRTYHRLACAIEDAGFEIRDMLQWLYGSGFPKSHDVSKGIDRAAKAEREIIAPHIAKIGANKTRVELGYRPNEVQKGFYTAPATEAARQWQGWGTALKPACEPIVLARKPLAEGTVAANVLAHSTGALNINGCRVSTTENLKGGRYSDNTQGNDGNVYGSGINLRSAGDYVQPFGRWPANVTHDGSDEVVVLFPESDGQQFATGPQFKPKSGTPVYGDYGPRPVLEPRGDSGSAARFFYTAKADSLDRVGSKHPTVKPIDLMQWLVRLITPPGGTILDPFAGTGTTAEAAFREGFDCVLIEREAEYQADIRRRMALVLAGPDERARESIKARLKDKPLDHGPLFAGLDE